MEIKKHPTLDFWCDELGNVYDKSGNIKTYKPQKRYNRIHIVPKEGGRKTVDLHRLVVETWLGEIPKGMQVNHIDGNRQNNSVSNLEICTPSQNTQHAFDTGLTIPSRGESHVFALITNDIVLQIYSLVDRLFTNEEIATKLNLKFKHVSLIRNGARWKHLFKEHNRKVIPSLYGNFGRDVTVPMLYLSYFTDIKNYKIAEYSGIDRSVISNIRLGKSYKWAFQNKAIIKEVYEKEYLKQIKTSGEQE